jgi:hypothetical protein
MINIIDMRFKGFIVYKISAYLSIVGIIVVIGSLIAITIKIA